MNIVYLCADGGIPFLGVKGASVHLRETARALRSRGHRVTVACATLGEGNPPPDVNVVALGGDDALEPVLRSAGAEVVLERYSLRSGRSAEACDALGIPLVLEVNAPIVLEAARHRGLTDVEAALERERETFAGADAAAVVSGALEAYVTERAPGLLVRLIPNGVDVARFTAAPKTPLGLRDGAVAIGYVGGMRPWHGVLDLIDAFAPVALDRPEAVLVVAGKGQEEDAARARAHRAGLDERLVFLGALPHADVPGVLASLDIGVAPYRPADDFYFSSLKVLEYMAAGLPVVHPAIGDLPDTVGPAGLAYSPGDPRALAGSITRLVDDAGLRARLGRAGRDRAASLTWDAVASKLEALMDECRAGAARTVSR